MSKIRLLEISGTPYQMGYQHGQAYAESIREFTEERIELCSNPDWTGRELPPETALSLGEACLDEHRACSPDLVEELRGISDATGLGLPELVIVNGFTDFVDTVANYENAVMSPAPHSADNCTGFIVPGGASADGRGFLGQTWDMHRSATSYVIMLRGRPTGKPAFLAFTIMGCVGMIGMNEAGIAVGINNLTAADGRAGVTWPFVIRKILEQTTLDDALECVTSARLAGGHNYFLADRNGRGYNVEAMSTRYHIEATNGNCIVHTNHCLQAANIALQRPRLPASQASSESRLERAAELLANGEVTIEGLMALTRDQHREYGICVDNEELLGETCGAAIMRPATRELWAVCGLPTENEYERFVV